MFTHEAIWRGIDRLANAHGYSASGLAKQAGLDPTTFNKSKRFSPDGKPRWPSTESLSKILAVTGATMSDLIELIGAEDGDIIPAYSTIPVIGFAQAGNKGYFDEDGYPYGDSWNELEFEGITGKNNDHCFALEVSGDSMQPLYREGDYLILDPSAEIRKGDRIVIKTSGGEVMAKELMKQNADKLFVRSLNKDFEDRTLPLADIGWMARIMWVSQ